jgi:hypothetical protein
MWESRENKIGVVRVYTIEPMVYCHYLISKPFGASRIEHYMLYISVTHIASTNTCSVSLKSSFPYYSPPAYFLHLSFASNKLFTRFPLGVNSFPLFAYSSIFASIAWSKLLSISLLGVRYAFGSNARETGV